MKVILFALFVALLMVGCAESSTPSDPVDSPKAIDLDDPETLDKILADAIDQNTLQKRGREGEELEYSPNKQTPYTGWAKMMHDNGQVAGLFQYQDGKVDGVLMAWHPSGQKAMEIKGDRKGFAIKTLWHENGQKALEESSKNNQSHGIRTLWYESGQKKWEATYQNGKMNGKWTKWYENGQQSMASTFKNGKEDGIKSIWYENGQKARDCYYENEKLITAKVWKPNGEKCPVTNVKNGNGIVLGYAANEKDRIISSSEVNRRWTYKNGRLVND